MRPLAQSDGQDAPGQNRADLGIAEESRFQGLGISWRPFSFKTKRAMSLMAHSVISLRCKICRLLD